jgi:hypothetical protein
MRFNRQHALKALRGSFVGLLTGRLRECGRLENELYLGISQFYADLGRNQRAITGARYTLLTWAFTGLSQSSLRWHGEQCW